MQLPTRNRAIALGVLVSALVVLGIGVFRATRTPAPVIEGSIDATQIDVASKLAGRVLSVRVREGEHVRAGQVLFTIDSPELSEAVAAARGQGESARGALAAANGLAASAGGAQAAARGAIASTNAGVARTTAGNRPQTVAAARAQYESAAAVERLARISRDRTARLYAAQVATRQERDDADAALRTASLQARSAYETYAALASGSRSEDITAARGAAASERGALLTSAGQAQSALGQVQSATGLALQARAALDLARAELSDASIAAPASGEITEVDTHVGELAPQGYPVVTLIETQDAWAVFNVPESLLQRFSIGTDLKLQIPALGVTIPFRVYRVSVLGSYATDRSTRVTSGLDLRTFEVRASPVSPRSDLRVGMSVVVVP